MTSHIRPVKNCFFFRELQLYIAVCAFVAVFLLLILCSKYLFIIISFSLGGKDPKGKNKKAKIIVGRQVVRFFVGRNVVLLLVVK